MPKINDPPPPSNWLNILNVYMSWRYSSHWYIVTYTANSAWNRPGQLVCAQFYAVSLYANWFAYLNSSQFCTSCCVSIYGIGTWFYPPPPSHPHLISPYRVSFVATYASYKVTVRIVRKVGRKGVLWGSRTFNYLVLTGRDGIVCMRGGGRKWRKWRGDRMIEKEGKGRIERKCRQGKGEKGNEEKGGGMKERMWAGKEKK